MDFFNLGLFYPLFTSIAFEGSGEVITLSSSAFFKNALFGLLISIYPLGQFLGAPFIGQLSDQYGRRKLLIVSLIGTVLTLFICTCAVYFSSLSALLFGRFLGGIMAGNMTLAYSSLADFSLAEEKVKNFSLIPLATGLGFASGPYLAGILANPKMYLFAGPLIPFILAILLACFNLCLVAWKFPETHTLQLNKTPPKKYSERLTSLWKTSQKTALKPYLWIVFLMISANLIFVQFVGPYGFERFQLSITQIGYLYATIGIALTIGHLFITRQLANRLSPRQALTGGLISLSVLLISLLYCDNPLVFQFLTFLIMLICAVAYTNVMTLISNQAMQNQQGETMGLAVAIQSIAEFLPALLLSMLSSFSQSIPLIAAAASALGSFIILQMLAKKELVTEK